MTAPPSQDPAPGWAPLADLAERVAKAASQALSQASQDGLLADWGRPVGVGHGDVTFSIDAATEAAVSIWLDERARTGPLSLFTEDAGWRHLGPGKQGPGGPPIPLPGFDHGGPRLILDPVDGTRHLMFDLRSAWCVAGQAGPGPSEPTLAELEHGVLAELPDTRAALARRLAASRGTGAVQWTVDREGHAGALTPLRTDADNRPDHGYFPFYCYHPDLRAATQELAGRFFASIEAAESAAIAHCYDDQYIASGGQLALLSLGAYRMVCDPRPLLAQRRGRPTQTAKPYDLAGAVLVAREAGAVVTDLAGAELDVPLDGSTEVGFCAFVNPRTQTRLWPHLQRALEG